MIVQICDSCGKSYGSTKNKNWSNVTITLIHNSLYREDTTEKYLLCEECTYRIKTSFRIAMEAHNG